MRLLMVSGDRQVAVGEKGPFFAMQREFSRHFERIDVLCPRPATPATVAVIHENVHIHAAPVPRVRMPKWIEERGAELVAEHGHTLVVSHDYGWFYNGIGSQWLSKRTGVPYVSEIHHVPGHPVAADLRERFDKRVARRYVRWARDKVIAFRVVNRIEMPALLASWGVPREKILVLPSLYVDFQVFHPPTGARAACEYDVCFVGRMVVNKGVDRIIDALALLAERGTPLRALFVGKGSLSSALKERVQRRGIGERTRFVPWVDSSAELAAIYRASRVVVCASTCEGGPRFTVEAMASGTPVVTTKVGVMNELVQDGVHGRIVGFDVATLADGIADVIHDEGRRARMGQAAALAVQGFEFTRTIGNYADGLKALVAASQRA